MILYKYLYPSIQRINKKTNMYGYKNSKNVKLTLYEKF